MGDEEAKEQVPKYPSCILADLDQQFRREERFGEATVLADIRARMPDPLKTAVIIWGELLVKLAAGYKE